MYYYSYISLGTGDTAHIRQVQEEEMCYKNTLRNPTEIQEQEPEHSRALGNLESHEEWNLLPGELSHDVCVSFYTPHLFPPD